MGAMVAEVVLIVSPLLTAMLQPFERTRLPYHVSGDSGPVNQG